MDEVVEAFTAGADAYWAGDVPTYWDNPYMRSRSPYLMGWYMASMSEVGEDFIVLAHDPTDDEFLGE